MFFPLVPCIICYMSPARWFPGWVWNPLVLTQCSHPSSAANSFLSPRKLPNTCCQGQMLLRLVNIQQKYKVAGPVFFWRKCMSYFIFRNRADPLNTWKAILSIILYGDTLSAVVLKRKLPVDFIGISVKKFFSDYFVFLHDCKYLQMTFQFNI